MPMYRTRYSLPNGATRTTQCYARNEKDLARVIKKRGMGETRSTDPYAAFRLDEPQMASELLMKGQIAAANHALVWTSMIAVRAGLTDAWGLLNDDGVLHEMAHLLHSREVSPWSDVFGEPAHVRLARRVEAFERLVPGVHPCWGGEDRQIAPPPTIYDGYSKLFRPYQRQMLEQMRAPARNAAPDMARQDFVIHGDMKSERLTLAELRQITRKHTPVEPEYTAPKHGARDFDKRQVSQGQAAKAEMVRRALAKRGGVVTGRVAHNMPNIDLHQAKIQKVADAWGGVVPTKEGAQIRGTRADTVIIDDAPLGDVHVDGVKVGSIKGGTIAVDRSTEKDATSVWVTDKGKVVLDIETRAYDYADLEKRMLAAMTSRGSTWAEIAKRYLT